jgi:hypothetical protein
MVGLAGSGLAETLNWPNEEMSSRGDLQGVIAGILIAIPSGAGIHLSVKSQVSRYPSLATTLHLSSA